MRLLGKWIVVMFLFDINFKHNVRALLYRFPAYHSFCDLRCRDLPRHEAKERLFGGGSGC